MDSKKLSRFEHEEAIKTFEYIQNGLQKSYPQGYFSHKGEEKLKVIFEHYFFNICKYTEDQAVENLTYSTLKKIGLENAMVSVYGAKKMRHKLLETLFPNRKIWELAVIPRDEWTPELKKEYAVWFLEEHLGLNKETVIEEACKDGIGKKKNSVDSIGRNFRRFTGLSDIIATAYDWDREEIKCKILSRTSSQNAKGGRVFELDTESTPQPKKIDTLIYILYCLDEEEILGCTIVDGKTEDEINEKAEGIAKENNAVKFWVEKINGGLLSATTV